MGFDFTKDDIKKLNYLIFKFSPKLSISFIGSIFLSNFTKYKASTFFQMFILLAIEEYINSYIPKWKDDEKPKITKAKKLVFSRPINISRGKTLNPAYHISPAKSLDPAHHEL